MMAPPKNKTKTTRHINIQVNWLEINTPKAESVNLLDNQSHLSNVTGVSPSWLEFYNISVKSTVIMQTRSGDRQ